jgi:hypothetical protein
LDDDEAFIPGSRPMLALGAALGLVVALVLAHLGGAF